MVDDIIHEIAHSIEKTYSLEIFSDGTLEAEFASKRLNLYQVLKSQPFRQKIKIPAMKTFIHTEYDQEFDLYLLQTVGYDNLAQLNPSIFPTPYSITSLSEYFATGFEELFLNKKNKNKIKNTCPVLRDKLNKLGEIL
jgi:hypothetical protein